MSRSTKTFLAWIAWCSLAGPPAAGAADSGPTGAPPAARLPVLLLPAHATFFDKGVARLRYSADKSAAIRSSLGAATRAAIDDNAYFSVVEMPPISRDEGVAIDEFLSVAELLIARRVGRSESAPVDYRAGFDRALGPSLQFLRERSGVDFAFGTVGTQLEQGKTQAAIGTALTVVLAVYAPFVLGTESDLLPVVRNDAASFVVDLRTGELRWFNVETGHQSFGIHAWNLLDEESARGVAQGLLDPYPAIPALEGAATPAASASPGPVRPASPLTGEFAIKAPSGWTVESREFDVTATRDGGTMNQMRVELRDHELAFPKTRQKSAERFEPGSTRRASMSRNSLNRACRT